MIYYFGAPGGHIGGASGEAEGMLNLWLRFGVPITIVPTWTLDNPLAAKWQSYGVQLMHCRSKTVQRQLPGIEGSTVVTCCNSRFFHAAPRLAEMGCKIIWVPCMTFPLGAEVTFLRRGQQFHAVVFQSEYQRSRLQPRYERVGQPANTFHVIRGAIAWWEMAFRPRARANGDPFTVGRLARDAYSKWPDDLWSVYGQIPDRQAVVMGVTERIETNLGKRPAWAEVHPPGAMPAEQFFRQLHCYVNRNGEDHENWPRVGLEAMAYGVPIVAENKWGWREMVRHGATGLLYDSPEQAGEMAGALRSDEPYRLAMAQAARHELETMLAEPQSLWDQWRPLLGL